MLLVSHNFPRDFVSQHSKDVTIISHGEYRYSSTNDKVISNMKREEMHSYPFHHILFIFLHPQRDLVQDSHPPGNRNDIQVNK